MVTKPYENTARLKVVKDKKGTYINTSASTDWGAFLKIYYSDDSATLRKQYGNNLDGSIMLLVKQNAQAYRVFKQLLYWFKYKTSVYKSVKELTHETKLTTRGVRTGLAIIKELSCIKYYHNSYQGTMVYELDETQLLIDLQVLGDP